MKVGEGFSVVDLENGAIGGVLTVTRLEDDLIMVSIACDRHDDVGASLRVTLTADLAAAFADAMRGSKGR